MSTRLQALPAVLGRHASISSGGRDRPSVSWILQTPSLCFPSSPPRWWTPSGPTATCRADEHFQYVHFLVHDQTPSIRSLWPRSTTWKARCARTSAGSRRPRNSWPAPPCSSGSAAIP